MIWHKVAPHHASQYLLHGIREYSQWFHSTDNTVANALSWVNNQSNEELTKILHPHCPSQLLRHFKIVPLPSKITSWLTSLLLWLPVKLQLAETHTRMTLGRGTPTSNTVTRLDSGTIFSSMECIDNSWLKPWELLPWLCIKGDFCNSVMLPWLKAQLQIPSMQWLWPSGKMDATIPKNMPKITLAKFYDGNYDPTKKTIPRRNNKKPYLSTSSTFNRTMMSNGRACHSRPLLGNAVVQVLQSTKNRTVADKAALPREYCLHQRRQNHQTHIS